MGGNPSYLNHTHIVLIPKVKCPKNPQRSTPYKSVKCRCSYYFQSIANRVKPFLPYIIFVSQSAFVSSRLITDNAMPAFEIFHTMKNKKKRKERVDGNEIGYE